MIAALAVIVTVPASVAGSYWLGERAAYHGCLATVDVIAGMKVRR